ncbi:MAG: DUF2461 domain-containing protein [Clostridia bacterium]|nr:DUF2461 domain-containing protein [Clostridia bacterium]
MESYLESYNGITPETLFLLADNRFRNSRDFYLEHKEEIKKGAIVPMRQIASIIGNELLDVDPQMSLNPVYMVSRVRRDTRYTKDKSLYRENLWIMFGRNKHQWPNYPALWFEISPTGYDLGIGFYGNDKGLFDCFRKALRERKDEFLKAAKSCEATGALIYGESYKKKQFEGCPEGLEDYYNRKSFGYITAWSDIGDLADEKIIEIIRGYYKAFAPMYKFMLSVSDEYFSEAEE